MELKEVTVTLYKWNGLASEELFGHHLATLLLHEGERLSIGNYLFERTKTGIEEIHVNAQSGEVIPLTQREFS